MAVGNDANVEGFVDGVRLAWAVHLMLILDVIAARDTISSASSDDSGYLHSCLEVIFSNNVFKTLLQRVLRTAAYQVYFVMSIFPCPSCRNLVFSSRNADFFAYILRMHLSQFQLTI